VRMRRRATSKFSKSRRRGWRLLTHPGKVKLSPVTDINCKHEKQKEIRTRGLCGLVGTFSLLCHDLFVGASHLSQDSGHVACQIVLSHPLYPKSSCLVVDRLPLNALRYASSNMPFRYLFFLHRSSFIFNPYFSA
jgi:hypothetical protein